MEKKKKPTPTSSTLPGLIPGLRMRGGTLYNVDDQKYYAIVHTWDNVLGEGVPTEWRDQKGFATEAEAMSRYKTAIRPELEMLMQQIQQTSGHVLRRKLQ